MKLAELYEEYKNQRQIKKTINNNEKLATALFRNGRNFSAIKNRLGMLRGFDVEINAETSLTFLLWGVEYDRDTVAIRMTVSDRGLYRINRDFQKYGRVL
jgi:NAD-dependent DNA ligase